MSPASGDPDRGRRAQPDKPRAPSPARPRVLVVEDEWLVSMEISTTLEDAGYEVVGVAVSAEEALRLAQEHRPDLVTMDIRLNGRTDGVDAALELNRRLGLRCLFVSAHSDEAMKARAEPGNPLGWVAKPFSDHQLLEAVRAAMRQLKD